MCNQENPKSWNPTEQIVLNPADDKRHGECSSHGGTDIFN